MHQFLLLAAETVERKPFFYENWVIFKQIIQFFGWVMSGIMWLLDQIGIGNIALSIILFTIVSKIVLLPLTIKQQKSTRLQAVIQPEIQALQKKYAGRRDSVSQQKMMAEQQAIQEKYGVSMFSGCMPMLIQMPILFGLYPVIYDMPKYVSYLTKGDLVARYPNLYNLLGIDLTQAPGWRLTWAILIPVFVVISQYVSSKVLTAQQTNTRQGEENQMMGSMKVMNTVMPLMLGVFAVNFAAFLGLYWIVQSVVTTIMTIFINKKLAEKPIEELIQENIEKANRKRARRGQPPIGERASMSTRNIGQTTAPVSVKEEDLAKKEAERAEKLRAANEYYASRTAKPGSLAAKANMVRDYNERNNKK